ncbi:MAG: acetate--CoA ligase family protein [Candidatus Geothermincolia bacterium]
MTKRDTAIAREYRRLKERGAIAFPEAMVKAWLAEIGVRVPRGRVAKTFDEASKIGSQVGWPVVIKVSSDRMIHKTEAGAVLLDVRGPGELRRAFGEMRARANDAMRHEGFEGVLVEQQVTAGVELIVGLQNDPHFGPVLMVGTGGTFTDLLNDVAFRMLPVTRRDVRDMLAGLAARPLLDGFRGSPPCDIRALEDTILAIAKLGAELSPYIESADFNPVIVSPAGAVVVDAKAVLAAEPRPDALAAGKPRTRHLDSFFNPASVAVIGASATPGKIGNVIVDSLVNHEFKGLIYPINPTRDSILGIKCYPALASLPEAPELAVMVVDLSDGPRLIRELAAIGTHCLLVVSGGGKELGGAREKIEGEMTRLSRELDVRVVGPNCIGAFDGCSRFDSFFHSHERLLRPPAGATGFITQSGTWGCAFLEAAGVTGVSKMVSYGNRVDVDEADLVACMAADPATRVIGSYIEGLGDGRKFVAAARGASRNHGKPVVAFKTGRNPRSATAAVSHTGAYGGTYAVYEGVLRQAGIITTDSFHELFAACQALALQPPAAGPRAAMLSNGAGPMVNALDLFPKRGLELVRLTRSSVRAMRDHFSFFYLVENPVDVTGSASAEDYEFVIRTLLDDPKVDIIMPFFVFQDTPLDESIVDRMEALSREAAKPIVACAAGGPYTMEMSRALERAGVPVLSDVAQWVAAASALVAWGKAGKGR